MTLLILTSTYGSQKTAFLGEKGLLAAKKLNIFGEKRVTIFVTSTKFRFLSKM